MGKKKGKGSKKKGKGSKKKGSKKGSKKKAVIDTGPELSIPERFIKFQLDSRAEELEDLSSSKQGLLEDTAELKEALVAEKANQYKLLAALRNKVDQADDTIIKETAKGEEDIERAREECDTYIQETKQEIKALRKELKAQEQILQEQHKELRTLENHKLHEQAEWNARIELLKKSIDDLIEDYENEKADIEYQFNLSKTNFEENVDNKMAQAKYYASESAVQQQHAQEKIAYTDFGLLQHEINQQADELERRRDSVSKLAYEYQGLMTKLFAINGKTGSQLQRAQSAPGKNSGVPRLTSTTSTTITSKEGKKRATTAINQRPAVYRPASRPTSRPWTTAKPPHNTARSISSVLSSSTSRPSSRRPATGFRALADLQDEEIPQAPAEEEVVRNLKLFPSMAKDGVLPVIVGKPKKRQPTNLRGSMPSSNKALVAV